MSETTKRIEDLERRLMNSLRTQTRLADRVAVLEHKIALADALARLDAVETDLLALGKKLELHPDD